MYNRYIPQNDGSYRRSRVNEPLPHREPQRGQPQAQPNWEPPREQPQERHHWEPQQEQPPQPHHWESQEPSGFQPRPVPPRPQRQTEPISIGSFLKQLLPRNFDTEDLLIILLLLLMSGDCREDQNTALLTLVLYLFL